MILLQFLVIDIVENLKSRKFCFFLLTTCDLDATKQQQLKKINFFLLLVGDFTEFIF